MEWLLVTRRVVCNGAWSRHWTLWFTCAHPYTGHGTWSSNGPRYQ